MWGFINTECLERVHRKFCKYVLNVKQAINDYALYSALGRYPLQIERRVKIVKYWFNLLRKSDQNGIINSVYNEMKSRIPADIRNIYCLTKLKLLFESHGFAEVWMYPDSVNVNAFISVLKTKLIDTFLVKIRNGLHLSTSMVLYKELCPDFEISPYLLNINNRKHKNSLVKLRLSSHQLQVETGRHTGVERQNRKLTFCTTSDIEDEYHFVLICPIYQQLRTQYISRYNYRQPSIAKMYTVIKIYGTRTLEAEWNLAAKRC